MLFITTFRFTISFLSLRCLKISTLIRNADFHSFISYYLDYLFEFGIRKTIEKRVDLVDYLVVRHKLETAKNRMEPDLASMTDEATVQHWCF